MGKMSSNDDVGIGREAGSHKEPSEARLCYVDDSRTSAYVVKRALEPFGYRVDHFQSAEPAFVALVQEDYDVLLTDLKVSATGMDGDDLIHTIRNSGHPKISALPIIVITGATDTETLSKVYDIGANQVMGKPVDGGELDGHIRRLMSERAASQAKDAAEQMSEANVVSIDSAKRPAKEDKADADSAFAADKDSKKVIPVLQAVTPESVPVTGEGVAVPRSEQDVENERISTLERAVDFNNAPQGAQENEDDWAVGLMDEIIEPDSEDEVVIIDPENKGGRHRYAQEHASDSDLLHEMNQHPMDAADTEQAFILSEEDQFAADAQRGETLRRLFALTVVVLVIVLAGAGIYKNYFDPGIGVETLLVESGEIYQSITMPGQVVSKRQLNVSASQAGRLVEIAVKEGDKVNKGQLLARLDDRELVSRLNRAKANLSNAREEIALAERTLQRLEKAYSKGAVAKRFVDDAEVELRSARTRAGIMVEEVRTAMLDMDKQKITAPFSGTITTRLVEVGQWITPSDALFTLVDDQQREIELRINAADSAAIEVGQTAFLSSDAFPGKKWKESVIRIGTAAENDHKTNTIKVFVSLGAEAPELRFGQQVDADIRIAWNPNTIKVPFEALITRGGQAMVAVLEEGVVQLKPVVTGIEDFSMVEIQQGLNVGEHAILARGVELQTGDKAFSITAQN